MADSGAASQPPPWLTLETGRPDERFEPIGAGHRLYPQASRVLVRQDTWDDVARCATFATLVGVWPRRRGRSRRETRVYAAALALRDGFTRRAEIAYVLGVSPATVSSERVIATAERFLNEWVDGDHRARMLPPPRDRLPRVIAGRLDPPRVKSDQREAVELTDYRCELPVDTPQDPATVAYLGACLARLRELRERRFYPAP